VVVDASTYDLLIGNEWLAKAHAIVDMGARKMQIEWKGRKYEVPLDTERGIRPKMVDNEDDDYLLAQFQRESEPEEEIPPLRDDEDSDNEESEVIDVHTVQFSRMSTEVKPPRRNHPNDAGIDLVLSEDVKISPWETYMTGTGLKFSIPEGYYGQIYPRSSLAL
jgi:dUTPase